jgi:hypothetical protein
LYYRVEGCSDDSKCVEEQQLMTHTRWEFSGVVLGRAPWCAGEAGDPAPRGNPLMVLLLREGGTRPNLTTILEQTV